MNRKYRILMVEDHTLFRAGLRALLSQDESIESIAESENVHDAMQMIGKCEPDLVLTDLSMPGINGVEGIRDIKRRYPHIHVLVLTVHKAEEYVHESLAAGAQGYILKDATHDELRVAINSVLNGKIYLSPDISEKVISGYLGVGDMANPSHILTHREREVLKLIAEGHPNKYIARYLSLSIKTVEKHRSNLMKKLNLHNASSLTSYAIENGYVAV